MPVNIVGSEAGAKAMLLKQLNSLFFISKIEEAAIDGESAERWHGANALFLRPEISITVKRVRPSSTPFRGASGLDSCTNWLAAYSSKKGCRQYAISYTRSTRP